MAIVYSLTKELDDYKINVSQDTSYKIYYMPTSSNTLYKEGTFYNGTTSIVPVTKDGKFKITLTADGESVSVNITVIKYLQISIIRDVLGILCGKDCGCKKPVTSNCLGKKGKKYLEHKALFTKLLSFQTIYLPTYESALRDSFLSFLEKGVQVSTCKVQNIVNSMLQEECITGNVNDVDKLFKIYVALYWYGMYAIDKLTLPNTEESLKFLRNKYYYEDLSSCLCSTCIDIDELESLFTTSIEDISIFYAFQFDDIGHDIQDIGLLTVDYLLDNGISLSPEDAEVGRDYIYTTVGRIGFVLVDIDEDSYEIRDILNNVVTSVVFDTVYDPATRTQTYVSKSFYVPSSIYFKFIKL